ncbi:hypothetical protein NE237_018749 [Protea cynaroides]|uniref:Uncharacterized protein n=1 Tax=Protea cynaroides TaxID=273540 RepID=A0A9Q0QPA9_9MAGN|nr:hypothetical protein NE237_018749 [Protea cynaroides]
MIKKFSKRESNSVTRFIKCDGRASFEETGFQIGILGSNRLLNLFQWRIVVQCRPRDDESGARTGQAAYGHAGLAGICLFDVIRNHAGHGQVGKWSAIRQAKRMTAKEKLLKDS